MLYLLFFILIIIVELFFIQSLGFFLLSKALKFKAPSYKKALNFTLITILIFFIAELLGWIGLLIFKNDILELFISICLSFAFFEIFIKKYYSTKPLKAIISYFFFLLTNILFFLLILLFIKNFIATPFYLNGAAMEPTLEDNQCIVINKFDKKYNRGDIVVFKNPNNPNQFLIKRIIALPNENIKILNNKIIINQQELLEEYLINKKITNLEKTTLLADQYFVLGDNAKKSLDSRSFGPITGNSIFGKYWFTFFKNKK